MNRLMKRLTVYSEQPDKALLVKSLIQMDLLSKQTRRLSLYL